MASSECIFCKIVSGAVPCHLLHRTPYSLAFLDINPLSANHFLVIPTKHAAQLHECEEGFLREIMDVGVRVMRAVYGDTALPAYNVLQNNGRLAHQTLHEDGLGIKWVSKSVEHQKLAELAAQVRSRLSAAASQ